MPEFSLTAKQIQDNWKTFRDLIDDSFPTRKEVIQDMYDELEDRIVMMPASSVEHYHNAIPGGYIDHVLRVIRFSITEYELWKAEGLLVENFTMEELIFAAMHHDLGKVGFPGEGNEIYIPNPSKWHRDNQGKMYNSNPNVPFALVQDTSLFLLQHYGVRCSWQEQVSIRIHDGLYDRANEGYYFTTHLQNKLRTNLPYILHNGDMRASRFEFERWAMTSEKLTFYNSTVVPRKHVLSSEVLDKRQQALDEFERMFGEEQ